MEIGAAKWQSAVRLKEQKKGEKKERPKNERKNHLADASNINLCSIEN